MRICFFGTPEFASFSLKTMLDHGHNVVCVVTAPDKPKGRGLKLQPSSVKEVALTAGIPVLQPKNLKAKEFQDELKSFRLDLGIIIAFRMLPKRVWSLPKIGTFNLHASLLPNYRGAAPINHAIINGEKETGLTTFFLKHEIDTGDILLQKKVSIGENETVVLRTFLYLLLIAISGISALGFYKLSTRLQNNKKYFALLGYIIFIAVIFFVMPDFKLFAQSQASE